MASTVKEKGCLTHCCLAKLATTQDDKQKLDGKLGKLDLKVSISCSSQQAWGTVSMSSTDFKLQLIKA